MRVVITGAAGFLGTALCQRLAGEHDVIGVNLPEVQAPPAGGEFVALDLATDFDTARLPAHVDAIVHLAQSNHYRAFPEEALDIFAVNVQSTARLLDWGRRVGARTFVHASSGSVYGASDAPLVESVPALAGDYYSVSKLAAEKLVASYAPFLVPVSLRYFFLYGPGQTDRLIPNLTQSISAHRAVHLAGPDGMNLNPIHVDDAVAATIAALALDAPRVINVAGSDVVSLRHICERLGQLCGEEPIFEEVPTTTPVDLVADIGSMHAHLVAPTVSFEDGLARWWNANAQ